MADHKEGNFSPPTLKHQSRYEQKNSTQVDPVPNPRLQPGLGKTSSLTEKLEEEVSE